MNIIGLTVCVNYSEFLSRSIDRWKEGCTSIIVVTSPDDTETGKLCREHGVICFPSDAFTRNGAFFNKGAAIAEAYDRLGLSSCDGWILFFDADVQPPADWKKYALAVEVGELWGAHRASEDGTPIRDNDVAGFFMLFHSSDPNVQQKPIVETCWKHAGNYDTEFQSRWWNSGKIRRFTLTLTHFGETSQNWYGRGQPYRMKRMLDERRYFGTTHERIG